MTMKVIATLILLFPPARALFNQCPEAPSCGLGDIGRVIHFSFFDNCFEFCDYFRVLAIIPGIDCSDCPAAACRVPETATTRLFNQDIIPDLTFGNGNANGALTVVRVGSLEIGVRAKTRYPSPQNPDGEEFGQGSVGPGAYRFPEGLISVPSPSPLTTSTMRQLWAFDWHMNTDTDSQSGRTIGDYTYEIGMDSEASSATDFSQVRFDPITPPDGGFPPFPIPDHSFDDNDGTENSGEMCNVDAADYTTCLDTKNVLQQSWQYFFFGNLFAGSFDATDVGNYVIYFRVLDVDAECNEKYVVAETYIEVLVGAEGVGDASLLTSPPNLPDPL